MECDGGKIVYVSNDFCEEVFTQSITELRAQYKAAHDRTAYKQNPAVKSRCQYKVREAASTKTLVGFGCDLSRFYCFQRPLIERREVKFIAAERPQINPREYYQLNEDMCAPGVIEIVDYRRAMEILLYLVLNMLNDYINSGDSINEIANVRNTSQIPTSCPCPGNLDVDGKLPCSVDELFTALDEDPALEFVCSIGGVAGASVTANNLSSSAICKGMTPTQKRHVTKSLPAPYMRVEEDTDDAKWSVVCYGISKDCVADDSDARINGNGYVYGGDAYVSVRLDYPAGEPEEQNFTCSYNDQVVLTGRKQDMGVVNMCGRTAYEVKVESNVVTARYDCLPRSVSVDGVTCLVWQDRVEKIRTINGATTTDEREKEEEDGTYCLLNKDTNELKVVFAPYLYERHSKSYCPTR
jgi:hypothetical protein